ncbi:MAG: acyltransferase [Ruminococcaceae bacterium]|nr:acyltransferase [Oscillospiraceae bacterium]
MGVQSKSMSAIDLTKFIFAILVVSIHTNPLEAYTEFGNWFLIDVVAGLAVPFFFMASGYFLFSKLIYENGKIKKCKENFSRFKKYYLRIFLLYFIWSIIYLCWQIPEWIYLDWFSFNAIKDYLLSAVASGSYYHFWYILSLLYVIPIMYFVLRHINVKIYAIIMAVIYVFGVLFYTYGNQYSPYILIRAWNIFPVPFVSILLIMPSVSTCLFIDKLRIKNTTNLLLFVVFYIFFAIESVLFKFYTERTANTQYALLIVPTIFFLFSWVKKCDLHISNQTSVFLRNMSSIVYLAHPMVMNLLGLAIAKDNINCTLYFVIVTIATLMLAFSLSFINLKFKGIKFLNYLM